LLSNLWDTTGLEYLPSKTKAHKKITRGKYLILFCAAVLGLAAQIYDGLERSKIERQEQEYRSQQKSREEAFREERRISEDTFKQKVDKISALQESQIKEYDKILMALATNSTPNPVLLTSLANAKENSQRIDEGVMDINAWMSELGNKRDLIILRNEQARLKGIEDDKVYLSPYLPFWDYTAQRLLNMLDEIARQKNVKLVSDYGGLPSLDTLLNISMNNEDYVWKDFKLAKVTLGTNDAWTCQFKVSRASNMRQAGINPDWRPRFIVECTSTNSHPTLILWRTRSMLLLPGSPLIIEDISGPDFKKGVDTALRNLIANEAEVLGLTR
jgi:hypothetical protein